MLCLFVIEMRMRVCHNLASMIVKEAKSRVRTHIKSALEAITHENIALQSISVHERLTNLEKFKQSKKVALFMSMPQEIQTNLIIETCYKHGKLVYLPRCNFTSIDTGNYHRKKNHLDMIQVDSYEDVLTLKPHGLFKLLEPRSGPSILDEMEGLDMIVLPAVGFDTKMNRLGHGAGFYDEFLSVYHDRFGKLPYLVGLGLKEQLMEQIPVEEHDWKLDCVITPERVISSDT